MRSVSRKSNKTKKSRNSVKKDTVLTEQYTYFFLYKERVFSWTHSPWTQQRDDCRDDEKKRGNQYNKSQFKAKKAENFWQAVDEKTVKSKKTKVFIGIFNTPLATQKDNSQEYITERKEEERPSK